jgi:ParB-like nuclease domain
MVNVENHLGPVDPERYGGRRLAVRYEPVAALRLDPQNPRLHSRKQVRQIAKSIASFGFNVPVLVDAEQSVIAGHGRILAAKELGWDEVPQAKKSNPIKKSAGAQQPRPIRADEPIDRMACKAAAKIGLALPSLARRKRNYGAAAYAATGCEFVLAAIKPDRSTGSDPGSKAK